MLVLNKLKFIDIDAHLKTALPNIDPKTDTKCLHSVKQTNSGLDIDGVGLNHSPTLFYQYVNVT